MVEFLSILVVVVLFCYFLYYKNKKYGEEQEMDRIANAPNMSVGSEVLPLNNNNMEENQNLSTRDLCAEVLRKLNCDVQFDDENEYNMYFTYQGENFSVDTWENGLMITIWDTWCGSLLRDGSKFVVGLFRSNRLLHHYSDLCRLDSREIPEIL